MFQQGKISKETSSEREKIESWLEEHPQFAYDYFVRKASRQTVASWLLLHSAPNGMVPKNSSSKSSSINLNSDTVTPVRKISTHEFKRNGTLRPILPTVNGISNFQNFHLRKDTVHNCNNHMRRKSRQELRALDEQELIFELVKDICNELEIRNLCHKILQNVSILTDADRCSLFLVRGEKGDPNRCLVSQLFDVSCCSTMEQMQQKDEIRIPWGTGIVGYIAESRKSLNISDCYQDDRFNSRVDQKTGYTTRNMLCMPILDVDGEVKGVAQIINKCGGEEPFTDADEKVFSQYLQFCGIGLHNAELYERSQLENKQNQVLLDLAHMIFREQSTTENIVFRIMAHAQSLLQCEKCQILLVSENAKKFSRVFDLNINDMKAEDPESRKCSFEGRFPINMRITGYVATTGATLNIPDVRHDDRFDSSVDGCNGFHPYSVLCMPIRNACNKIIAVCQLTNKLNGTPFNKNDEHLFKTFALYYGMGIENTQMYVKAAKAFIKTKVILEVLSYHTTSPTEKAKALNKCIVPSMCIYRLQDSMYNALSLDNEDTLKASLRMFTDLNLIEKFHINYDITKLWHVFGEVETLSLIIACLCHDRGTNNSFQLKPCSTLAQLYSTSTMEHHLFDQFIILLNSEGNRILDSLSPDEYSTVVNVIEDAIWVTDLAVYFRAMLMIVCGIAANTKPRESQRTVAELVASEFFQQSDIEREKLRIQPIDMMNCGKKNELQLMQILFIDFICAPIYEAFVKMYDKLQPLLDVVKQNREQWLKLAKEKNSWNHQDS
ncbi:dual 3',5'-cyclic-AMP and -GMP phosphodiesterase 11-like isoform X3 [Argiope bruennichi]|uniref:dual 3',5'-cyclic-AMP and -GMP phosphodiesterase 11-like isoform X3 n=1 Tax=Argiope bruennichi TaxID=94029 RepID=UPI0024943E09|nr:dual 3',5'-cyclic-AMP and -GMP phosphodiesterase 11-like isoform X3 [Argiope bruennichi]